MLGNSGGGVMGWTTTQGIYLRALDRMVRTRLWMKIMESFHIEKLQACGNRHCRFATSPATVHPYTERAHMATRRARRKSSKRKYIT